MSLNVFECLWAVVTFDARCCGFTAYISIQIFSIRNVSADLSLCSTPQHKGDASQQTNYRGVAVTCVLAKAFSSFFETEISGYMERHSLRTVGQSGFRRKLSTLHPLFTMAHLQAVHCTAGSSPGPLYVCFVD